MSRSTRHPLTWPTLVSLLLGACAPGLGVAAESASAAAEDQFVLEIRPDKNRAYVHEAVPLRVTLLAGAASIRNIQYPRLVGETFRTTGFAPPRQTGVTRNDREYMAYEFSTTLVASRSGELKLGPSELSFDLLAPGSGAAAFFGDSEPRAVTVHSPPVRFAVLPLPTKGRPDGFSGAVGRFTLAQEVTPQAVRSGDPVTLTTRIEGVGNIDSFSCPALSLSGVRAYPPVARHAENSLICEQVLIPEGAAPIEIPAASVSYFDPSRERYQTLTSQPIALRISAAPTPASAPPASAAAALAPETSAPQPVSTVHPAAIATAVAGALALLLVLILRATRRSGMPRQQPPVALEAEGPSVAEWLAAAERALAGNDPAAFHTAVFRALQRHLALRHGLPAAAITEEIVARVLCPAGVDNQRLEAYADLFAICNRSRYTPDGTAGQPMPETLRCAQEALREG